MSCALAIVVLPIVVWAKFYDHVLQQTTSLFSSPCRFTCAHVARMYPRNVRPKVESLWATHRRSSDHRLLAHLQPSSGRRGSASANAPIWRVIRNDACRTSKWQHVGISLSMKKFAPSMPPELALQLLSLSEEPCS